MEIQRTAPQWAKVLTACKVKPATAARWGQVMAEEIKPGTFSKGDKDVIDFLPNIIKESAYLETLVENLNYTPDGLVATFGIHRISPARAKEIGRTAGRPADQRAIANEVYGGEWGRKNLGNTQPDDGWTFRGRGVIQVTGRSNYDRVGDLMGQDLIGLPHLLEQPRFALEACLHWWEDRIPDSMLGETTAVRKRVNGGTLGLDAVRELTAVVRRELAAA